MAGKDYAALAKQRIQRPGQSDRMPRLLIYSRNKKGKTHFCATAPNVLILDPEDGTIEETTAPRWPIDKWEDINDAYSFLRTGKHEYEWVALDGITRMHNMAIRWVMNQAQEQSLDSKPVQIGKQHYGRANEMMRGVFQNFHALRNMGVIFTAQEKMITVTEMDEMDDEDANTVGHQFVVDLSPGARSAVNAIVDLTGRLYVVKASPDEPFIRKVKRGGKTVTEEYTRQRRLMIGPDDMYETGYRSKHVLPDYIKNPTVTRVVRAIKEGVTK